MKRTLIKQMGSAAVIAFLNFGASAFQKNVELNPIIDQKSLTEECQNFINKVLPENNWTGGFISVPEDWNNPSSRKINVFYYHNKTISDSPSPIVFLNGGPFLNYHVRMVALSKQLAAFEKPGKQHTFVMIDQRGTGCSTPNLPEDQSIKMSQYKYYGSQGIVRDAEVIRKKLFNNTPWKIFSQSYGGFLTSRYLQYFPASISEVHTYAPAVYDKMTDFFMLRGKSQHVVMQKFLDNYPKDRAQLELALEKIRSPEGQKYCIVTGHPDQKVCGQPLFDAMAGAIGQGRGRSLGSTEVWDGVKKNLLALLNSDSNNSDDPNHKAFVDSASSAGSFFFKPTIAIVFSIWMQDAKFLSGRLTDECDRADHLLSNIGLDSNSFLLNECRVIRTMVPENIKSELEANYQTIRTNDYITQKRLVKLIKRSKKLNPEFKYFLYTGSLDSIVQIESLKTLIDSGVTDYKNFEQSGHAGWLYEPIVWNHLIK